MVKIIMHGCNGHMGQVISSLVEKDPNAQIVAGIDIADNGNNSYPVFTDMEACDTPADVLIDFSSPKAADQLMEQEGEAAMEMAANIENTEDTEQGAKYTDADDTYAGERGQRKTNTKLLAAPRVLRFESLRPLEKLAGALNMSKPVSSSVYFDPDNDHYYLVVKKGRMNLQEYMVLCNALRDYVSPEEYSVQLYAEQFCKEHFEIFIPKNALGILKNIETGMD